MKTMLLSALAVSLILFSGLLPGKAVAQKPKSKTERITIKSSAGEPMEIETLHDTIIISNDGKDTTIIKTTREGKEKKVTVRKIITSGGGKNDLRWMEAETEMLDQDSPGQKHHFMSKEGEPGAIRIEKRVVRGDGTDSVIIKEIRHKDLEGDDDIIFDEPKGGKHKSIKVITTDGEESEYNIHKNTTVIILKDEPKSHHRKVKKGDKQKKIYVIEEEKNIKK